MADEADSGTEQQQQSSNPHKIKRSLSEDQDNDNDKVPASSNSNDLNAPLLRCERCDKFETHSHPLLLVHSVQCAVQHAVQQAAAVAATNIGPGGKTIPVAGSSILLHNNTATSGKTKNHSDASNIAANIVVDGEPSGTSENHENSIPSGSTPAAANLTENSDTDKSQTQNANRKLFECDVCNMKFSNGANMRRHKMRHTGVKPYECRVCQKRFFRKDHLAEHFTTHTKTLPYHCPICNRGFQRQIAMRAHFQNEHVGQHDLVKTCPLCSYRAGTMKSLRVHFFNRHGIDLDNPGPGAPSSLLLALDPQNTGQYLPTSLPVATTCVPTYSDSGDSLRSTDNATPPMHFLTPHVEISMAENVDSFKIDTGMSKNSSLDIKHSNGPNGISPSSPQSIDSNSNVPSSSHTTLKSLVQSPRNSQIESHITPSISLIPIKQEPSNEDFSDKKNMSNSGDHLTNNTGINNSSESSAATSSLTSLIKVSPLKSLLREDLKRRICARANTRAARNLNNNAAASISNYLTATNLSSAAAAAIAAAAAAASSASSSSSSSSTTTGNIHTDVINASICSGSGGSGGVGGGGCSGLSITTTSTNGIITSTAGQEAELSIIGGHKKCLQCLFCGIEFPDQTLYFLHKGCHSDSNPWKCNICGEQCNNVYEFNSHLLSKSHQ